MNYKVDKKKVIGLVIVILFLISGVGSVSFINSQENPDTPRTPKTSVLQFDDDIPETIYQNIDYEFSTVFYDDANYRNEYTSAYLETESTYLTDVGYNDSISGVVNNFTEYAENDDITIAYGILDSNGTLSLKDADSTDIDSTEGGFYNATYSFTDDPDGTKPDDWLCSQEGGAAGAQVIAELGGHAKVAEFNDDTAAGRYKVEQTWTDQTTDCTIEFWHRATDYTNKILDWYIRDDGVNIIQADFGGSGSSYRIWNGGAQVDVYVPAINTWFRHKIEFDISASTFDWTIYNEAGAQVAFANDFAFRNAYIDGIDQWWMRSDWGSANFIHYFDAIDYSWTAGYYEGRIISADNAMVDLTILIDGLNPHLSLEALEFELYSYYKTNESVNTKFYFYNFTNTGWDLLDDSIHLNFNDKEGISYQTPTLGKFVNASGIMKIRFLVESDTFITFQFSIDQLGVDIWTKLHLAHTRSFSFSESWRYRWHILGSDFYSEWVNFMVGKSISNFEAISESEYPTRWILYSNATSPTMVFQDDINSIDIWNLDGVSDRYFEGFESSSSSYLLDNYTFSEWKYSSRFDFIIGGCRGITWDGTHFWLVTRYGDEVYKYTYAGVYTETHFDVGHQDGLPEGITWDGTHFWYLGGGHDEAYKYTSAGVYTGVHFYVGAQDTDPNSITWDGTSFWVFGNVNKRAYKYTAAGVYTGVSFNTAAETGQVEGSTWDGTHFWVLGGQVYQYTSVGVYTGVHFNPYPNIGITWDGTCLWVAHLGDSNVWQYEKVFDISKNYYGSGYTYMQTDETELISLLSSTYATNYTLSSGEYFEVDFQTSSDSQINFILLKEDIVQETLTLSPSGNTDFTRHTTQIIVDESVEFDQLKISGNLEDTDYVVCYDIKTYGIMITGDSADFYIGSKDRKSVILSPDNYSLKVYENGIKKVEKVIELTYDKLYQEIYQPIGVIESRVSLFSTDNTYLNFNEFRIKINRSLNEGYVVFWLLDTLFFVDTNTEINFTIYDKFNTHIDSFVKMAYPFIDLYIEVYSLTVKNIMEEKTTLLLNTTNSYELLSLESIEFILPKGYYQLSWTDELGDQFDILIYLDENQAYELNSSYYEVYFSLFTYDGFGVNHDFVRFYINNARKDFGFNTLKQDTNTLKILDYFNATLFNSNINLKQFTEYNIYIEIYTMIIFNNYSHSIKIAIERNDIEFEQIIEAQFSMPYRMLPNVEYIVSIYYLNGTLLEEREVELDENNKIVPFGFYSEEVPYYPSFDNTSITIVLIILIFIGIISLPTYFAYKYNKRVQRLKFAYTLQHTIDKDLIEVASGRSSRMNKIK